MLISPNSPIPAYPMPSSVEFSVKSYEKRVVNNAIVVFYKIHIVATATQQTRYFRYSTLRVFHKRLKAAYESKLGYFEFPKVCSLLTHLTTTESVRMRSSLQSTDWQEALRRC